MLDSVFGWTPDCYQLWGDGVLAEWNASEWLTRFRAASLNRDGNALRELRSEVFRTTVDAVRMRAYDHADGRVVLDEEQHYADLHSGTVFHEATDSLVVPKERRGTFSTEVRVANADCLDVANLLGTDGGAPAVLNMANRRNPGGGVLGGAGAQEENLFRRSNLLWSLYQFADYADEYGVPRHSDGTRYPIPRESGGIYSPPAAIFRSSEPTGYAFLARPHRAAFLTVPAIHDPDVIEREGGRWLSEPMAQATTRKIRAILRISAHHGHADIVLSAFGCGAFRNPPRHVARLFREAIEGAEFHGVFRRIVFAVLDDHNAFRPDSPDGNYLPFERELARVSSKYTASTP